MYLYFILFPLDGFGLFGRLWTVIFFSIQGLWTVLAVFWIIGHILDGCPKDKHY